MVIIIIVLPLPQIVMIIIGYSDYNLDALTALAEPFGHQIFFSVKVGNLDPIPKFLSKFTKPTKGVKTLGEIGQKSGLDQQTGKMMMKKKIGRMTKGGEPRWLPRWSQL